MLSKRQLVLAVAGAISISLGLSGAFIYPLMNQPLLHIVIYEVLVMLGILGLLALINARGLEAD